MKPMTRFCLLAAALTAAAGLGGCASSPDAKPAVCDGQHRRPANPYGSVLPTLPGSDAPKPVAAGAGAPQPSPAPALPPPPPPPGAGADAAPGALSALDLRSGAACGRAA